MPGAHHLHLVCEARDRRELARGIHGLAIRVAKRLNGLWRRSGRVWADRYHDHILRTPREVRTALVYVLHNARHHGVHAQGLDVFTSGRWFDGWTHAAPPAIETPPTAAAATWLLRLGWRRHGLIGVDENPGANERVIRISAA